MTISFFKRVYAVVQRIPAGKIATYSQVAALVSTPRAARVVGWALKALPPDTDVPWQRVVNSAGRISIENLYWPPVLQAELLQKEGVEITQDTDGIYWVKDLAGNLWHPKVATR